MSNPDKYSFSRLHCSPPASSPIWIYKYWSTWWTNPCYSQWCRAPRTVPYSYSWTLRRHAQAFLTTNHLLQYAKLDIRLGSSNQSYFFILSCRSCMWNVWNHRSRGVSRIMLLLSEIVLFWLLLPCQRPMCLSITHYVGDCLGLRRIFRRFFHNQSHGFILFSLTLWKIERRFTKGIYRGLTFETHVRMVPYLSFDLEFLRYLRMSNWTISDSLHDLWRQVKKYPQHFFFSLSSPPLIMASTLCLLHLKLNSALLPLLKVKPWTILGFSYSSELPVNLIMSVT